MKYSVIIPVYNMEKYLRECIDSIVSQARTDIEIILVNDGSIDNSLAICQEYEKKYPYVNVLDKKNTGSMDSWIKGVELAQGEYICFIDADDFISKRYFSILDQYTTHGEYDMILFDFVKVYKDHELYKPVNRIDYGNMEESLFNIKNNYYAHEKCSLYRWDKVLKAEIIKENIKKITYRGIYFEDQVTLLNFFSIKKAIYIEEKLYCYRMRKSSVSHGFNYRIFDDNLMMEKQMLQLTKEFGYNEKHLYQLHLYFLCLYAKNALRAPKFPKKVKVTFRDIFSIGSFNRKIILLLYKLKWKSMFDFLMRKKQCQDRNETSVYFE